MEDINWLYKFIFKIKKQYICAIGILKFARKGHSMPIPVFIFSLQIYVMKIFIVK
jgi:hypothetical protein